MKDIAVTSFQQKAGYVPSILPESAYLLQVHDTRPITPSRTTSQLYRMLLGEFQFEACFNEWCLLIAQHGMRMPPELIPTTLNSQLVVMDSRQISLLAMGSYARWIVAHDRHYRHWKWVMQTPTPSVEQMLEVIDNQSNEWVRAYEAKPYRLSFHKNLLSHKQVWNDALAECVLSHIQYLIQTIDYDQWRMDFKRLNQAFAYYAPLKYYDSYRSLLVQLQEMHSTSYDTDHIILYRHKLHRIIADDAAFINTNKTGSH